MSDACNDLYNALNTPMHIDLDIILTTRNSVSELSSACTCCSPRLNI